MRGEGLASVGNLGSDEALEDDSMIECSVCSFDSAIHQISNTKSDFFYCNNCRSWLQVDAKGNQKTHQVRERWMIDALDYTRASNGLEGFLEGADFFRRISKRAIVLLDLLTNKLLARE